MQSQDGSLKIEQILALIPCPSFLKDLDGTFIDCNYRFLEFAGIEDKSDLIGKSDKVLPWGNRWESYYQDDQYVITSGQPINRIERVKTAEKEVIADTTKAPWQVGGQVIGILGMIYDITDLINAKEKAEEADKLKVEFIENMQHDLRTPAYGVATALADLIKVETDPLKKNELSLIFKSAKQLYNLCLEVTEFSVIEHHERTISNKEFDLKELINSVIDLNQTAAIKKGLTLDLQFDPMIASVVKSDYYRLKRILINLISNAIKFTHTGSVNIKINLFTASGSEQIIAFEVSDTGIGIPQDKKSYIDEKFSRAESVNRGSYRGIGLGLRLVKNFVEDLRGEIEVKSQIGLGTTFFIKLPFDSLLCHDSNYTDYPSFIVNEDLKLKGTKIHVLLIEDDSLAQLVTKNMLCLQGAEVTVIGTLAEAKILLDSQIFNIIFSDIRLPDGLGQDLAFYVKAKPENLNYRTPMIALTAHSGAEKTKDILKSGFLMVVTKPLSDQRYWDVIHTYLMNCPEKNTFLPIPENTIIDMEFSQRFGMNRAQAFELFAMLDHELPMNLADINIAREQKDIQKLRDIFHKLKGGFCYVGVPRLQHVTDELHEAVKHNICLSELEHLFSNFYNEVDRFIKEFHRIKNL